MTSDGKVSFGFTSATCNYPNLHEITLHKLINGDIFSNRTLVITWEGSLGLTSGLKYFTTYSINALLPGGYFVIFQVEDEMLAIPFIKQ